MKLNKALLVLFALVLLIAAGWYFSRPSLEERQAVNQTTGEAITDCNVPSGLTQGTDWEYVDSNKKSPTADCKPIRFLK